MHKTYDQLSEAIEAKRKSNGWTTERMAKELGVGRDKYLSIVLDKVPELAVAKRAYALGIPAETILSTVESRVHVRTTLKRLMAERSENI